MGNENEALLLQTIPTFGHITTEAANVILQSYRLGTGNVSSAGFIEGAAHVFKSGYYNSVPATEYSSRLTDTQRDLIYEAGRKAAQDEANAAQAARDAQANGGVDRSADKDYDGVNNSEPFSGQNSYSNKAALLAYKSGGSYTLNAKLREGMELSREEQDIVEGLDDALPKLPAYKGTVYRNIIFDDFGDQDARDAFVADHTIGEIVTYIAYTSASTRPDGYVLGGNHLVHLIIDSVNGRNMEGYGNNFESEVLFSRDSSFITNKITYDTDGTPTIYLTEVANETSASDRGRNQRELSGGYRGQQKTPAEAHQSKVQRLSEKNSWNGKVQSVSERDSEENSSESGGLSGVQAEVSASDLDNAAQKSGKQAQAARDAQANGGVDRSTNKDYDGHIDSTTKNTVQEGNDNGTREEVSHRGDAESSRKVGKDDSGGEGGTRERCERRIKEILRRKTVKSNEDGSHGRGRVELRETRGEFESRSRRDGLMYVETGKVAIAFQIAPVESWNANAKTAADKLTKYGFEVVVFAGEKRHNYKGVTETSVHGTTVRHAGNLTIFISSDLTIDGMETAYHEAFHATRYGSFAKYHEKIANIVANNIDTESEAFTRFISKIADLYAYTVSDVSTSKFDAEIIEEFYAWYVGKAYATETGEMQLDMAQFSDVESIKQQIDDVYAQMEVNADKALPGLLNSDSELEATVKAEPAPTKKGGVFRGYDGQRISKNSKGLTKKQRVAVDFTSRLAKRFGMTVYFYESYEDENGKRVYKAQDGSIKAARKGFYNPKDGSIHIDLNGDNLLFTVSHELIHFIKDWSPVRFKKMADIIMAGFGKKGITAEELIANKQAEYAEDGIQLTEPEAFEEVIAASLECIMADGRVMELLQKLKAEDKGLKAKVKKFFQDIGRMIRDTIDSYRGVKPDSAEGRLIQKMEDIYSQLQEAFAESLYDAGETFRKTENTTGEGGVRYKVLNNLVDQNGIVHNKVVQPGTVVYEKVKHNHKDYIAYLRRKIFNRKISVASYKGENIVVEFAKDGEVVMKAGAKNPHKVLGELERTTDRLKMIAVINIKELLQNSSPEPISNEHSHQWLDQFGWQDRMVTMLDHGEMYPVILHIANARDGRHILYDVSVVKEKRTGYDTDAKAPTAKTARAPVATNEQRSAVKSPVLAESVSQDQTDVNKNLMPDSDEGSGVRYAVGNKTDKAAQEILEKENAKLREDVAQLKELLRLQGKQTHGTKFTASSVEAAARYLKKNVSLCCDCS